MVFCSTCQIDSSDGDRSQHVKSEWHIYNLKRVVANLLPIPEDVFMQKHEFFSKPVEVPQKNLYCHPCKTVFANNRSYEAHLISKKHQRHEQKTKAIQHEFKQHPRNSPSSAKHVCASSVLPETNLLPFGTCLFCSFTCSNTADLSADKDTGEQSMAKRVLEHMRGKHLFTVPYPEKLVDAAGLLKELSRLVGQERACLYCGRQFDSLETGVNSTENSLAAVRAHMLQTDGHLRLWCGEEDPVEVALMVAKTQEENPNASIPCVALAGGELYSQYYDGSDVFPSLILPDVEDDDVYEVRLPSGTVIGHRKMRTIYQQHLGVGITTNRALPIMDCGTLPSMLPSTESARSHIGPVAVIAADKATPKAAKRLSEDCRKAWDLSLGVRGNLVNRARLRRQY